MADSNEILRTEPSPRWVRVFLNGEAVANSRNTQLVWQGSYPTSYWFPRDDVQFALLTPTAQANGRLRWNVRVGDRIAAGAAWQPIDLPEEHAVLSDHIAFEWASMDEWREEEEAIIGHPRDPYHRVDCVQSSRHVVIEIDGQVVADSNRPMIVFETGMRNRYYLPHVDVPSDALVKSERTSVCPYKGTAAYWSVKVAGKLHNDVAWSYPDPLPESERLRGHMCFYDEHVDVTIDGERQTSSTPHLSIVPDAGARRAR